MFVLDRDTGKPVFPVEEVPAPASDVPGEVTSPTYLRPKLPAPYARQRLTADDLTTRTPEANRWAREQFAQLRSDGPFKPLDRRRRHDYLPRLRRRRRMGRTGLRPGHRPAVRERQRDGVARLAGAQRHRPQHRQVHLPARLRRLPRRQRAGLAAAVSRARRTSRSRMTPDSSPSACARAADACPRSRTCRARRCDAIAQFLFDGEDIPAGAPDTLAHQPGVSLHRLPPLARSGGLSGRRHALGHAERHRSRHRQIRVAHSLRRISRARGARHQGHRQRELRRPAGDRRRTAVHRRHASTTASSAPSTSATANYCGKPRCPSPPTRRRSPTRSTAASTSPSSPAAARSAAARGGGVYLAYALPAQ